MFQDKEVASLGKTQQYKMTYKYYHNLPLVDKRPKNQNHILDICLKVTVS